MNGESHVAFIMTTVILYNVTGEATGMHPKGIAVAGNEEIAIMRSPPAIMCSKYPLYIQAKLNNSSLLG